VGSKITIPAGVKLASHENSGCGITEAAGLAMLIGSDPSGLRTVMTGAG
jgi:hypothetical protein